MDTDLTAVKAARWPTSATPSLPRALIAATYGVPQTAPGWLAWLDSACDWELNRRRGIAFRLLQPPEAAIPPEEDAVSIDAAMAMRATFAQDSPAILAFFDALADLLTGGGRKH